jgi:tRNA pseudouridine38-40 synthase
MRICPEGNQRYKLLISYDGTGCAGWQRQAHDATTIQATLEGLLSQIYDSPIRIVGSSRTDSGVHAEGQVAHFDAVRDPARAGRLVKALNLMSPGHIAIKAAWETPPDFHAIHSTVMKTYKYRIFNSPYPSAIFRNFTTWVHRDLDIGYLNEAAKHIMGTHDFSSFQTEGSARKTTIRHVLSANWVRKSPHFVEFSITGTGFLKQMVRNLVGTMLDLQKLSADPSQMTAILDFKDRRKAGATAPAGGLCLYQVYYPQRLDFECRKI